MRIATLSLNPAIDQTARIPSFTAGRVNRVEWEQSDAGGKGVNVASFLADAGIQVAATGLFGSGNIEPFLELFSRKGIDDRCVRLAGRTRVNVKIADPVLDQVTDINFPGLSPAAADLVRLTKTLDQLLAKIDWLVLSGSVPAGIPDTIYAELIDQLQARGKQVLLDASGAPFAEAVTHGPDIIKPNIDELAELVGRPLTGPAEVLDAAMSLIDSGIRLVAVSMGPDGAVFVEGDAAVHAIPPTIQVKSTVGAGDAMVAGILTGTARGLDLADRARLATAFSLGALGEVGPHLPPMSVIDDFATRVQIKTLK
ncbi:1-phosphofructokinase [Thiorhodococcus minor]|uniref:Phosphofructokinase n=1 Tax=Thiorhodococcus minor TaxID=57489 RepID=A0A6M0K4F6_9GAMM|nr:1-phosphofructokinase [Thiorhodococcus minor]NEV63245.1 1-phosphofructokinase [Thiorhodococcus minor]